MYSNAKRRMIPLIIGLIIMVVMIIILSINVGGTAAKVKRHLDLGNKYYSDMNYEMALAEYLAVININPNKVSGYIGASTAYVGLDNNEAAIDILERGYSITGDQSLLEMIDRIKKQTSTYQPELNNPQKESNNPVTNDNEGYLYEEILQAYKKTGVFSYNLFWNSSETLVDKTDRIIAKYDVNTIEPWDHEFCKVTLEGIDSKKKMLEYTETFYTTEVAEELLEQKAWVEQDGKLYVSEPEGLGGPVPDKYYIKINRINAETFELVVDEVSIIENYPDEHWIHTLNCKIDEGNFIFDEPIFFYPDELRYEEASWILINRAEDDDNLDSEIINPKGPDEVKQVYYDIINDYKAFYNGTMPYAMTTGARMLNENDRELWGEKPGLIYFPYDESIETFEAAETGTVYIEALFFDVNKDGVDEMFVVEQYNDNAYIHDVWTFVNGELKSLGYWHERYRLFLTANGEMIEIGTGSAFNDYYIRYAIGDEGDLVKIDTIEKDLNQNPMFTHNGNEISENEYLELEREYDHIDLIDTKSMNKVMIAVHK